MELTVDEKLRKATKDLMRDRHAYVAAGTMLMGKTEIVDDIPTARTNGRDKQYGRQFIEELSVKELAGVVLHEAVHIMLRHIPRHRDLIKEDAQLANMAFDYADNAFIRSLPSYGVNFCLPDGHLYDPQFENMTVRQIYEILKQENENGGGGGGRGGQSFDEHDVTEMENLSDEQRADLDKRVTEAIQQSVILAGMNGIDVPRQIMDAATPKVDWKEVLAEFMDNTVRGKDEYTFSRFNRKRLMDDLYMPSVKSERVGDVIVAIDTSGSIRQEYLNEFFSYLSTLCEQTTPESVTVLWWDTEVRSKQVLTDNYDNLKTLLKPRGGGGTTVSCVSKYVIDNKINGECLIVLTDGYVEDNIKWNTRIPTLWISTQATNLAIPSGTLVSIK